MQMHCNVYRVNSKISNLIRGYLDTPKNELLTKHFVNDFWNLTDIFLSVDRRIGKRQLIKLKEHIKTPIAQEILNIRLGLQNKIICLKLIRDCFFNK